MFTCVYAPEAINNYSGEMKPEQPLKQVSVSKYSTCHPFFRGCGRRASPVTAEEDKVRLYSVLAAWAE